MSDALANPLFVGPPDRRPIQGTSQREEKQQQSTAINAWEDEGGSTAANARQRTDQEPAAR